MNDLHLFIQNIKDNKDEQNPKKGISIAPINFDNFQASIKDDGVLDLNAIVGLYEWSKGVLETRKYLVEKFISYHPDSPENSLGVTPYEPGKKKFEFGLDLEDFMESSKAKKDRNNELPFCIPDNYELADKVIKEYEESGGNIKGIEENSFRECAMWVCKDRDKLQKFADYVIAKYVTPQLNTWLEELNVERVYFEGNKIDFVSKK